MQGLNMGFFLEMVVITYQIILSYSVIVLALNIVLAISQVKFYEEFNCANTLLLFLNSIWGGKYAPHFWSLQTLNDLNSTNYGIIHHNDGMFCHFNRVLISHNYGMVNKNPCYCLVIDYLQNV